MTGERDLAESHSLGVIWDIDGTLIDSAELHFRAWHKIGEELGFKISREQFASTFGLRNPDVIFRLFGTSCDVTKGQQIAHKKEAYYRSMAASELRFLAGAEDRLNEFQGLNIPQALATSAPRGNVDLFLDVTKSQHFFAAMVTMEEVARGKPDPEVFLMAAQRAGVDPRLCVVFEDAPAGVLGAKRAGMKCIGTTACGYHTEAQLKEAGADLVIDTLMAVDAARVKSLFS